MLQILRGTLSCFIKRSTFTLRIDPKSVTWLYFSINMNKRSPMPTSDCTTFGVVDSLCSSRCTTRRLVMVGLAVVAIHAPTIFHLEKLLTSAPVLRKTKTTQLQLCIVVWPLLVLNSPCRFQYAFENLRTHSQILWTHLQIKLRRQGLRRNDTALHTQTQIILLQYWAHWWPYKN